MDDSGSREQARVPEDLSRLIVQRLNVGDIDGLVELYEADAVLALPDGAVAIGHPQIRLAFEQLAAGNPQFEPGHQYPTLQSGDLALTSARLGNGSITAEVARRRADGTWR